MKIYAKILLTLSLFSPIEVINSTDNQLLVQADSAYAADDFDFSVASYEEAIRRDGTSPQVLYNLGNAYFRAGQPGKSIVSYERALRLDPSYSDAQFNLSFVKSKIVDKQVSNVSLFQSFFNSTTKILRSDTWAWLGTAFFLLSLILAAVYLYTTPVVYRKFGFFGALTSFPLAVIFYVIACISGSRMNARDEAIVTSPSVVLSTAPRTPRDRNEEVALLHEGSSLKIIDSLTNTTDTIGSLKWYKVELDNDHRGWAPAVALEII